MKEYQERYIANLKEIFLLTAPPQEIPQDVPAFAKERRRCWEQARVLAVENTVLLREELFPVLDNIVSASEEDVENLEEFAGQLLSGATQLDVVLNYYLHNALIVYARRWNKRDMLIKALYNGAMALFYMEDLVRHAGQSRYKWKMSSLFGEAASFIKQYDEIEDQETRGYIHRAMGNLALAYADFNEEDATKKMKAIRRSLRFLEDPVYREKSPDLPWDLYIYKSHQERTTGLGLLRAGVNADPQILGEVMESAEYVINRQSALSQRRGMPTSLRWQYSYQAAQYHCGIRPLSYLLGWMESTYMNRDETDYSGEGFYHNMFLPALYAIYIDSSPEYRMKKKEVMGLMYRRMMVYVRNMPDNQMCETTLQQLLACLQSFVEYPDGVLQKDFILQLVVCRGLDAFVASRMAAEVAGMMVERVLELQPQYLLGALGFFTVEALQAHCFQLKQFVFDSCLLHNVGILVFSNMIRRIGRSWLEEEKEMYECHVYAGEMLLSQGESTRPYISAAKGHHKFYNDQEGYPKEYSRKDGPEQVLTDIVSGASHLMRLIDNRVFLSLSSMSLDQAMEQIKADAGIRLAPEVSQLLLDLRPQIEEYLVNGQVEAYREAFALQSASPSEKSM